MTTLNAHDIENNLEAVIEQVSISHEPVFIEGRNANAVLVSEADWSAIQETLHLLNLPGMSDSLKEGMATPISECSETLDW